VPGNLLTVEDTKEAHDLPRLGLSFELQASQHMTGECVFACKLCEQLTRLELCKIKCKCCECLLIAANRQLLLAQRSAALYLGMVKVFHVGPLSAEQ
jgi:hypothetical protein